MNPRIVDSRRGRLLLCYLAALYAVATQRPASASERSELFFFTSQGKTGLVRADGGGLKYFDFRVPNQASWQPGPFFSDGKRVVFLSMEPRHDGPGRPFSEYYSQTPTHIWLHDLEKDSLVELCTKDRIAPFETPALLIADERLLVQVIKDNVARIVSMKLDGTDARDFTRAGEGVPYGFSLSPDGKRVAFHLAGEGGYKVFTSDVDGAHRTKVAAASGHLYFGTSWSPTGDRVLYVDCQPGNDPGHDWADVCVGSPDGTEHRVLTKNGAMWFAATYGPTEAHGSGSNLPSWTHDGKILFPRRLPDTKVPWEYRAGQPDLDHFNRAFKPDSARGGVGISRLDPRDGQVTDLTVAQPGVWDFRASESPDGGLVVFCRAPTGESPTVWVMNADGTDPQPVTKGINNKGVDHPRWLPGKK
jgi:TolB protein